MFSQACVILFTGGGGLPQCMLGYYPPGQASPWGQAPPRAGTPDAEHAGRDGQRAGGTHPTGMQSCSFIKLIPTNHQSSSCVWFRFSKHLVHVNNYFMLI